MIEHKSKMQIKVGTGILVTEPGVCTHVSLMVQSVDLKYDFIILEPSSVDIILGVQWLRILGKCEVDWENQTLSYLFENKKWTLKGDPSIFHKEMGFDMVSLVFRQQSVEESQRHNEAIRQKFNKFWNIFKKGLLSPNSCLLNEGISIQFN